MASTDTGVRDRRARLRSLLIPVLLFLGVFSAYLSTAERHHVNVDAYAASAASWRIATAGTPWFDGLDVKKIAGTHTDGHVNRNGTWILPSPNGHVAAQRMAGPIIAGVPFYWLLGGSGTNESDFQLWPGAVAASVITAAAVLLMFLALRRRAGTGLAVAAALIFAFATPTWTVSANGLWTHPITQLGIAGAAYAASRNRWWLAGAFLGIGMFGRPHLAVIAAVLGLGMAWSRRDWRIAAKVGVPAALSLGLVVAWNHAVFGPWSISGGYSDVMDRAAQGAGKVLGYDLPTNYLGFFVSLDRGLLVWTPALLLFLPAVVRARASLPSWTLWLLLGGAVYTFLQIRLADFTGGIFLYGYRLGLELVTTLVPVLAFSAPFLGRVARRLLPVVVAVQIAAMAFGAVVEEGFFIPRGWMWRENSFWLAVRTNPQTAGMLLVAAVLIGLLVSIRYMPMPADDQLETARQGGESTDDNQPAGAKPASS